MGKYLASLYKWNERANQVSIPYQGTALAFSTGLWDSSPYVKQTELEKAFKLMLYLNHTMLINKKKNQGLHWWKEKLTFPAPVLNNWTSSANDDLPQDSIRWCSNFHAHKWNLVCKQRNKLEKKTSKPTIKAEILVTWQHGNDDPKLLN